MVVLDTNILIDHLRQSEEKITSLMEAIEKFSNELAVSVISVQELFEGKSTRDRVKESELINTLSLLKILPYNFEVAKLAGEISREDLSPVEFPDAAIAATCIINGAYLLTLNKKDFARIPGLELV